MSKSWSDDRVGLLKLLCAERWPASHIARVLNVSRNAVIGKVHRLKLTLVSVMPAAPRADKKAPNLIKSKALTATAQQLRRRFLSPSVLSASGKAQEPKQMIASDNRVSFGSLREHHCRWMHVDGLYCGNPKNNNSSYCLQHHSICYRKAIR